MYKFYDTDLQSENPQNMESDNEPPSDQEKDKKQIKKEELRRIYKEIWKVGKGIPKPAKYDEVQIKIQKYDEVMETKMIEHFKENAGEIQENIGLNDKYDWFDLAVEGMRKGEICLIIIENLKYVNIDYNTIHIIKIQMIYMDKRSYQYNFTYDQNKMKVLDFHQYYMVQLIDWLTVIDLDQDFQLMKKIHIKGSGQDRCEKQDEIAFKYQFLSGEQILQEEEYKELVKVSPLIENEQGGMLNCIWRVMRSMKQGEKVSCKVAYEYFQEKEKNFYKEKFLELDTSKINLTIEIYKLQKIDDIYHDGAILKKKMFAGADNQKPEKTTKIKFDLCIKVNNQEIYSSTPVLNKDDPSIKQTPWEVYLDEFKISKMLKNSLLYMKRKEISQIICKEKSLIQYGKDYDIIMKKIGSIPDEVEYIVYHFQEAKNTFNMTIDEKIEQAERKKKVGIMLIKELKNYKKALKTFETVNAYFELGNFYEEDKINVFPHRLSSYLNTSLCYMKLNNWDKLIGCCKKIQEVDPTNCKGIYRWCIALKEKQEYQEALNKMKQYVSEYEDKMDTDFKQQFQKLQAELIQLDSKYQQKQQKMFSKMFKQ